MGVICNQTSVLPDGTHLVDALLKRNVNVTALFGPEHGVRGDAAAGKKVADTTDPSSGLPVYSLYGKTTKPTPEMLSRVDVLLFDIQDIGSRYYTYAGTMAFAMEAAAQNGKSFIVLDRPNPVNGVDVEGTVLDLGFRSLVGMFPVPARHGLTMGELAKMIVGEGWIDDTRVNLEVVEMVGWKRSMWHDETGLPWIAPSPNMKTLATATVYPGTCLVEATNLSEGRGTAKPFEQIGAPGVDGDAASRTLNALGPARSEVPARDVHARRRERRRTGPEAQGPEVRGGHHRSDGPVGVPARLDGALDHQRVRETRAGEIPGA